MMVWVADTHGDLGGLLCFLTAVVGVTACYMELLIVAIPVTSILIIYFLMIISYDSGYPKDFKDKSVKIQ